MLRSVIVMGLALISLAGCDLDLAGKEKLESEVVQLRADVSRLQGEGLAWKGIAGDMLQTYEALSVLAAQQQREFDAAVSTTAFAQGCDAIVVVCSPKWTVRGHALEAQGFDGHGTWQFAGWVVGKLLTMAAMLGALSAVFYYFLNRLQKPDREALAAADRKIAEADAIRAAADVRDKESLRLAMEAKDEALASYARVAENDEKVLEQEGLLAQIRYDADSEEKEWISRSYQLFEQLDALNAAIKAKKDIEENGGLFS